MNDLEKLPNISKVIAGKLMEADISSPGELFAMGSKEAFIRIRLKDSTACLNMLCALEERYKACGGIIFLMKKI